MSGFTCVAGSATPTDPAGLVEWTDARFSSDGSLRALYLPPLWSSAPLVIARSALPGDGAFVPDPKLDGWDFDITGSLLVDPDADEDVKSGFDYLLSKVNVALGWQDVLFNSLAWAETRQMRLRVTGQITAELLDKGELMLPERIVTIPVSAADPRLYSSTLHSLTGSGTATNAGNYDAPFTVTFNGPRTNPLWAGPGVAGTNSIRLGRTLAAGEWVKVTTYDPDTGQMTAVDNTGANAYGDLTAATGRTLAPGANAITVSSDAGAGNIVTEWRDAWA